MKRNANLDVLRCLAMFLIVLEYVYQHSIFYQASSTLCLVFIGLTLWHVDAFLALSGWFGVKFSIVRLWHIGLAVLVFVVGALAIRGARANYLAPHVILMAIAMFIFFEKFVRVPTWLGRVCVWAAPSMFGVYLLHEVSSFGKAFHRVPVGWCVDCGMPAWLSILIGAAVCFAICLALDVVRRVAIKSLNRHA